MTELVPTGESSPARVSGSPLEQVQLHLVDSLDEALEFKRWLGERRPVLAFDTESGGLDHHRDDLRLVQVGDRYTGWALPWPLWGGLARECLHEYGYPTVAHHRKFDYGFLSHRAEIEVPWANGHDTMIQSALVNPTRPKGLKSLAATLVDKNVTAGERLLHDGMKQHGWSWATVPYHYPPYWIYGALDPVLTAWVHEQLYPQVQGRYEKVYDLELAVARICGRMSHVGMKIDRPYVLSSIEKLREYDQRVRAWLKEEYGITSLLSARQIAVALEIAGHVVTATTPTGLPKVDKETLEEIALATDVGEAVVLAAEEIVSRKAAILAKVIIDARHAEKITGSYLEKFLELADSDDVVHPQINTIQARTGRMSVTDPALQTLHRDDKIVRGSFIPREGHVFVTCDFSQIEMRLAAALSGDERLIAAFHEADNGGRDFYSGVASMLFGEDVPKEDPRRQAVKTMSYAKLYGAGVPTMAKSIGLPQHRVKVIHDMFNERFPRLDGLAREITGTAYAAKKRGEVPATYTNRGRYLPADPGREFALLNYRFQAEAADVLKQALVDLDHVGLGDLLRLPVHDEVILECPREDAEDVLHLVEETMTDSTSYAVPITCDGKVLAERWKK